MTDPTTRDLISRLADVLDNYAGLLADDRTARHPLATEARAYLAAEPQGEGEGPADHLAQAPQPVPVSERLPGEWDCDADGRCWMLSKIEPEWRLISADNPGVPHLRYCFSHWLPAHALPLPTSGEVEG